MHPSKCCLHKLTRVVLSKRMRQGMAPGGGVFLVFDAASGQLKGTFQENRYLTDVRTGAAGGIAVKHLSRPSDSRVGFIGTGAVSKSLARAIAEVRPGYSASAFALEYCDEFCKEMAAELGTCFTKCETPQEVCAASDIVVTCTPGGATVLEKAWVKPGAAGTTTASALATRLRACSAPMTHWSGCCVDCGCKARLSWQSAQTSRPSRRFPWTCS